MPGTRSSARIAGGASSSPKSQDEKTPVKNGTGTKRKATSGESPTSKRGKQATPKKQEKQKTIDEFMPDAEEEDVPNDIEMKDAADEGEGTDRKAGEVEADGAASRGPSCWYWADKLAEKQSETKPKKVESAEQATNGNNKADDLPDDKEVAEELENESTKPTENGPTESSKSATTAVKPTGNGKTEESKTSGQVVKSTGNGAVEEDSDRQKNMPSNIIEKGIIYFFTRGRVGVDDPESVQDLQRTYIVLRPIPTGAKIGEGPLEDLKNNRLIALPKKVLPKSGSDRFMVFVEKAETTIQDLKDNFLPGSDYETKTTGTRHQSSAIPVGEGIYALTTTGRTSHLAYMLTIPSQLGEVQESMGLREKGSFVTSLKNPTVSGPANASLPEKPDFPQSILDGFSNRSWMPIQDAKYLDYPNAQLLLIGEQYEKALEPTSKDQKHDKETPDAELEKLEHEDEIRVQHLNGDDSVYDDLGISKKDYPDVLTTW